MYGSMVTGRGMDANTSGFQVDGKRHAEAIVGGHIVGIMIATVGIWKKVIGNVARTNLSTTWLDVLRLVRKFYPSL